MVFGVQFESVARAPETANNRMDVGCFIGFVRSRGDALPSWLHSFFEEYGFLNAPGARSLGEIQTLLHVPVPIGSFATFEALFDWENESDGVTYLGAAVRSFFAQGGRKCYIVRAGDPLPRDASRSARVNAALEIMPSTASSPILSPHERGLWRGLAHLHGLAEVSTLCVPDLPALLAQVVPTAVPVEEAEPRAEFFVDCTIPPPARPSTPTPSVFNAPRMIDEVGYGEWATHVKRIADFLQRFRKDVQFVAAVPLPAEGSEASIDLLHVFVQFGLLRSLSSGEPFALSSAHVQLAYPWVSWLGALGLPEALEPPDAIVAGMLARTTLVGGAFVSAAGSEVRHVTRVHPELSLAQRSRLQPLSEPGGLPRLGLQERVSLIGQTVDGFQLLSDVTTSADEQWRPANSNRLMSVWVRALERLGETFVFEASNEALWSQVRSQLSFIGDSLFRQGALRGLNAEEAYEVRCDRATMSTNDIDNGRVIAALMYRPALPIEGIRVTFALQEAQRVSIKEREVTT